MRSRSRLTVSGSGQTTNTRMLSRRGFLSNSAASSTVRTASLTPSGQHIFMICLRIGSFAAASLAMTIALKSSFDFQLNAT